MSSDSNRRGGNTPIRSRRQMLQAAGGIGLASVVAGCLGEDPEEAVDGDTDDEVTDDDPDEDDGEIPMGGTLRAAWPQDADTIHPHKAPGAGIGIVEQMCNALFKTDPQGEFHPDLATSMPEVSDDGLTQTVEIREGVEFHPPYDREVTAEDVVENWRTVLDADYGGFGRGYYVGSLVGDDIDPEETVQATGDYEVTFYLEEPHAAFLSNQARQAAFGWFSIIPMEAVEEHGDDFGTLQTGAWGTGAFMYNAEESVPGSEYVLERNPNYFREDEDGNQLPYLDRLEITIAPENSVRRTQLQAGDIDVDTDVAPTDVETLEQEDGIYIASETSSNQVRMWVNLHTHDPTANMNVRKAMMYAMNREQIVDTRWRGHATVAHSMIPPFLWAYDEDAVVRYDHDPEQASELLAQEGYEDGFDLDCVPTNQPRFTDTATIIQENYAAVDIDMNIEPRDAEATYDQFAYEIPDENWHSAIQDFIWTYEPNDFTAAEFHTDADFNYAHYSNEEADELMDEARRTIDQDERADLYSEIQHILSDELPLLPIVFDDVIYGARDNVEIAPWPSDTPLYEEVWKDEE